MMRFERIKAHAQRLGISLSDEQAKKAYQKLVEMGWFEDYTDSAIYGALA